MDIFSLPQYIRIMVSNYQVLQTIFAVPEDECHTRQMKKDEQFSPTVTIVDTATQQTLDCVLLLCSEKPPEVNCRTLFCYIAVQVSYPDVHGIQHYPLYHMERKPSKQGKLSLVFCFHQPGTVCNIQLSINAIVDSERVEYVYNTEVCDCVLQIIDRDQHGVVRIKEPSRLKYTGPLATKRFHNLKLKFTNWFRTPEHKYIHQVSKQILDEKSTSTDFIAFVLCWEALSMAVERNYECAEKMLNTAWKKASKLECENGLLLQGKVLRHLAFVEFQQHNDHKALYYLSQAKERFFNAAPSNETAHTLYTEFLVKMRSLFSLPDCSFSSQLQPLEEQCELILQHADSMEEFERGAICSFLPAKAAFHLRSYFISLTDNLPPKEYSPTPDDLRKAEECLNGVSDTIPSKSNLYVVGYYYALCDLHIWKQQYSIAMNYLETAREVHKQVKFDARIQQILDQRLKLLERLQEDEKIDEILEEYSNADTV